MSFTYRVLINLNKINEYPFVKNRLYILYFQLNALILQHLNGLIINDDKKMDITRSTR